MAKEELVGQVADQMDNVAEEIEVVAEATRRVSRRDMKFLVAGLGIGIPIGIGIGYLVWRSVSRRSTRRM